MKEDKRKKNFKKRKLESVIQKLFEAEASGDKFQIRIWKDILRKLESDESTKKQS